MKRFAIISSSLLLFSFSGTAIGCNFEWRLYGSTEISKIVEKKIGSVVTDEFCKKYSKTHKIVIITDTYFNNNGIIGNATTGLIKKSGNEVPNIRRSSNRTKNGSFTPGEAYELTAIAALDTVIDCMSAFTECAN